MLNILRVLSLLLWVFCPLQGAEIAVLTIAAGEDYYDAVELGIVTKTEYCKRHNYDFICLKEVLDPTRPPSWSKLKLIQQVLPKYQWVFWTDADALIMNPNIRLEDLIDDTYSVVITSDPWACISCGHFFVKNTPWSYALLDTLYARTNCINHLVWEQQAFIETVQEDPMLMQQIKVLPQRSMNAFPGGPPGCAYQPGDFIVHFAGFRDVTLIKEMMNFYFENRMN